MTMSLVTVSASAKDFKDDDKITYDEAVTVLSEIGVVDGYTDGNFNPTTSLNRGQAAKIICNLILGPTAASALAADTAPFPDVPTNHTFAGYIAYCANAGIITGYADGTFKPGNTLSGYAFMKMLLGALGYDQNIEGYVGDNWSINVAKQAIGIGLNKGLSGEFNGVKAVTREEACLFAFNTLQADLVEYDTKITANVNGAEVTVGTSNASALTWKNSATRKTNIKDDDYVQFAEQYFPKLVKKVDVDAFDRPAYTWVNNKVEIGTFVDWDKLVEEYTVGVSGQDLYELLGKTIISNSDVEYYVDGAVSTIIKASNMIKTNTNDYGTTGNGILTQVFLDTDEDVITITSINTFAAEVTSDYNTKKESLNIDVKDGGAYTYTTETLSSDDFDDLDSFEDGDVVLVTVAETSTNRYTVQSIVKADSITNQDVTKFSKESYLVAEGTQYDYAERGSIWNALDDYYDNLLDNTYDIYFDTYGYVIATQISEAASKYLFMTGYDLGGSYLATKNADAFAIFTDGTSDNIKVNVIDTNKNIDTDSDGTSDVDNYDIISGGENQYNRWFSYTTSEKSGSTVYTLKPVAADRYNFMFADQYQSSTTDGTQKINVNNVRIVDTDSTSGSKKLSYGNDDSVFITVKTGAVSLTNGTNALLGITEVTGTYTGVQDVDLKIYSYDNPDDDENNDLDATVANNVPAVFALYDEDLYIVAAIVVGEDNTTTDSYAYAIKSAKNEYKSGDYYYWDFDAIVDGVKTTLTVKEKGETVLQNTIKNALALGDYSMFKLTYDKDGYVVGAYQVDDVASGNSDKLYDIDDFNAETIIDGSDYKVYDVYHEDDVKLYAIGRTLYAQDSNGYDVGVTIAANAPVVVIEKHTTGLQINEYDTIKQALDALDNSNAFSGHIAAALNSNGTAKYLVLKSIDVVNEVVDDGSSTGTTDVKLVSFDSSLRTMTVKTTSSSTSTDIENAIKNALTANGYTWTSLTDKGSGTWEADAFYTSSSNNANTVTFTVTVQ
jgi:hypothetical protein